MERTKSTEGGQFGNRWKASAVDWNFSDVYKQRGKKSFENIAHKKNSVHKNSAVPFPYLRYQLQRNCTLNVVRRKIKTFFLRWFVSNSLCSIPLILSYVCRYSFQKSSLALTVSKDALDLSVWHQPNDSWQIGGSFIFDKPTSKAVGSFCYQLEMKDTVIKGMIDSDWSVGCTYNRWGELFISLISVLVSMAFN